MEQGSTVETESVDKIGLKLENRTKQVSDLFLHIFSKGVQNAAAHMYTLTLKVSVGTRGS